MADPVFSTGPSIATFGFIAVSSVKLQNAEGKHPEYTPPGVPPHSTVVKNQLNV